MSAAPTVDLRAAFEASGLGAVLEELDRTLVGLAPVKRRIREIAALLLVDRLRRDMGLTSETPTLSSPTTGRKSPACSAVNATSVPMVSIPAVNGRPADR